MSDCCDGLLEERPSETVVIVSDGLLAQTLRTACVRSAHILLVEFLGFIWATACFACYLCAFDVGVATAHNNGGTACAADMAVAVGGLFGTG